MVEKQAPNAEDRLSTGMAGAGRNTQLIGVITTSTRRFMARPVAEAFDAIGSWKPRPE